MIVACERMQCCSGGGASASEYRARLHHPRGTCPHPAGSRWAALDVAARMAACEACEHAVRHAGAPGHHARQRVVAGAVPVGAGGSTDSSVVHQLAERVQMCRRCEAWDDSAGVHSSECDDLPAGELLARWSRPAAACPRGVWGAISDEVTHAS